MIDLQELLNEYARKRAEAQENFIACYIAKTGLSIEDIILVEQHSDDGLRIDWHCEPAPATFIAEAEHSEPLEDSPWQTGMRRGADMKVKE